VNPLLENMQHVKAGAVALGKRKRIRQGFIEYSLKSVGKRMLLIR
jgi:hypothetical protein